MRLRLPSSTRTDTRLPYATLFQSRAPLLRLQPALSNAACTTAMRSSRRLRRRLSIMAAKSGPRMRACPEGTLVEACAAAAFSRSEEHTSELQSLMRIQYAVLWLQNKHTQYHQPTDTTSHITL